MLAAMLFALAAPPSAEATWTLHYVAKSPDGVGLPARVEAELALAGEADGETTFASLPEWGGASDAQKLLAELRFTAGGAPVDATQPDPLHWIVRHAPGAPLVAHWRIVTHGAGDPAPRGNDYRPYLDERLFFLIGDLGLLRPAGLDDGRPHALALRFDGFVERGFAVASSFGAGPDAATATASVEQFCHAAFLAGDVRLHAFDDDGGKLLFALHGEGYGFTDDELIGLARPILAAERAFFRERSDPLFVITLVPNRRTDTMSTGGTGLTQSFALFLSHRSGPGDPRQFPSLAEPANRARLGHLLAHEFFHHWNGERVRGEEPEGRSYWFSEGFTDFYARRLLFRAGITDVQHFCADLGDSLETYWTSPVRNADAERIAREFWSDESIQKLPYRRGDLVAMKLDHAIRLESKGARSLDDFMREAIRRGLAGERLDTANLLELAADETSAEFAEELRATVVGGADLQLDDDAFAPFLVAVPRRVTRGGKTIEWKGFEPAPGLDLAAARARL